MASHASMRTRVAAGVGDRQARWYRSSRLTRLAIPAVVAYFFFDSLDQGGEVVGLLGLVFVLATAFSCIVITGELGGTRRVVLDDRQQLVRMFIARDEVLVVPLSRVNGVTCERVPERGTRGSDRYRFWIEFAGGRFCFVRGALDCDRAGIVRQIATMLPAAVLSQV